MDIITRFINEHKLIPVKDIKQLDSRRMATIFFIHRKSKRFHTSFSRNIKGYLIAFNTKCKGDKSDASSEFFSVFSQSTVLADWDIFYIYGLQNEAAVIIESLVKAMCMTPFKRVLRCESTDVEKDMYTLYKVTTPDSDIVRWFISMMPHTNDAAIDKAKFGLSGVSVAANGGLAFIDRRVKFMHSKRHKVVRFVDHPILKTVRPSMYSKISNKLNTGELTLS